MSDSPPSSPCVSVCLLNEHDICAGCYRSGREIAHWGSFNDDEKRAVLRRTAERRRTAQTVQLK